MQTEFTTKRSAPVPTPEGQGVSILRYSDVMKKTGLSRSAIHQRLSNDEFPAPIQLGGRAVGFIEHEVNEWLEQLIQASRAATQSN